MGVTDIILLIEHDFKSIRILPLCMWWITLVVYRTRTYPHHLIYYREINYINLVTTLTPDNLTDN